MSVELDAIESAITVLEELKAKLESEPSGAMWHFNPVDATHHYLRSNVIPAAAVTLQTNPSTTPTTVLKVLVEFAPY